MALQQNKKPAAITTFVAMNNLKNTFPAYYKFHWILIWKKSSWKVSSYGSYTRVYALPPCSPFASFSRAPKSSSNIFLSTKETKGETKRWISKKYVLIIKWALYYFRYFTLVPPYSISNWNRSEEHTYKRRFFLFLSATFALFFALFCITMDITLKHTALHYGERESRMHRWRDCVGVQSGDGPFYMVVPMRWYERKWLQFGYIVRQCCHQPWVGFVLVGWKRWI